jgi:hypothetical protein
MKTLLYACAALVMALGSVTAHAADVTGAWSASMQTPDGNTMQMTFTFKQDGATLTGTTGSMMGGDPIPLTDGKVDGNKISFKLSFNGMTITDEGTISDSGDEIKLTSKSDGGDFPGMEMTLKRDKAGAAPAPQL